MWEQKRPMYAYDVRLAGGPKRTAMASSRQAAAELILSGAASAEPPASHLQRPPVCFVKERGGGIAETPFWRAEVTDDPDAIPVEDRNASNDE